MSKKLWDSVRPLRTGRFVWLVTSGWWVGLFCNYLWSIPWPRSILRSPDVAVVYRRDGFLVFDFPLEMGICLLSGWVLGSMLVFLVSHSFRSLGLIPLALTLGCVVLALHLAGIWTGLLPVVALGLLLAAVRIPLSIAWLSSVPFRQRTFALAGQRAFEVLGWAGLLCWWVLGREPSIGLVFHCLFLSLPVLGALMAWGAYFRPALELLVATLIWPLHRVCATGPGLDAFPERGPVLVVANHSAWFDPVWLELVLPRPLIPMMGSRFYDLPILRWLMRSVVGAIRVAQDTGFRREAPELLEGARVLERGQALVLFPEGRMRRREDQPLKLFGQGVWHILQQQPQTPIIVCWIEGGWGSYFSYCNGPPTKNKSFDFRRLIQVGVATPQTIPPEVLADQMKTRLWLMEQCLQARRLLGLEALPLPGSEVAEVKSGEE